MNQNSLIYIAGHQGMVGSAIHRNLKSKGYDNIVVSKYPDVDLTNQNHVMRYFEENKPEYVIDAAAKVGGIQANNTHRGQFIYENMMIQSNLIHASHLGGVKKLLFLGSSCIYPRISPQPIKETYLLDGPLEQTNEPYAIAKIAGIKMCESYYRQYDDNFVSVMPTNLYGYNDNFDLSSSHVLPALMRKFHSAKVNGDEVVTIWGSGEPYREFLHVEDMANACVFVMNNVDAPELYNDLNVSHINIGTGEDLKIAELAGLISKITGYHGKLAFDKSKPDGTPRKLLDVSLLQKLGWHHSIELEDGIQLTYDWFMKNIAQ
jgi:GDP-L-fucose synthase